ncbi:MAG: DNA polymerase Y family protein [Deltaproteobacteria bacterium]|nr:DNA polymerase Y family protein [Deltaproteobacteria bacterium]
MPALPLQILLRCHPEWRSHPVAVVSEDRPTGLVVWRNQQARRAGVAAGMRYVGALALAPDLRAGCVAAAEIETRAADLTALLWCHTPGVEPCPDLPGVCWLDACGLSRLYPDLEGWAAAIRSTLQQAGWVTRIAVGRTRFGTLAAARVCRHQVVFGSAAAEHAAACQVQLERLDLAPDIQRALARLGVQTVGDLIRLPAGGLRLRFGPEIHLLHRLASGEPDRPLEPARPPAPIRGRCLLDEAESDSSRLLFEIKRLLHPLLRELARGGRALAALWIRLLLDRRAAARSVEQRIQPARPTLEAMQLLDLVRLWLDRLRLEAGAIEIALEAEAVAATAEQLRLFSDQPGRDLAAAERALARIRAELGAAAVVRAEVRDAHLPEASFIWSPVARLALARFAASGSRPLVRRLNTRPVELPPRLWLAPEGWMLGRPGRGAVVRLRGPYVVSGGWWAREVVRDYHYAETERGEILWLYRDRRRRRWLIQGAVE